MVVKIARVEHASSTHSNIFSTLLRARSCGAIRDQVKIAPSIPAASATTAIATPLSDFNSKNFFAAACSCGAIWSSRMLPATTFLMSLRSSER